MYYNDLVAKQEAAKKAAEEEAAKKAEEEAAAKAEAEKRALEEAEKKSRQNYNAYDDGINLSDKGQAGQTGTDLSEAEIEKVAMEIFVLPEYWWRNMAFVYDIEAKTNPIVVNLENTYLHAAVDQSDRRDDGWYYPRRNCRVVGIARSLATPDLPVNARHCQGGLST